MVCTLQNVNNWLKINLTPERYEHSLGTAECAKELAKKFGLDEEKAYFTGLIHDCAKYLPKDETERIIREEIKLTEDEMCSQKILHAPAGSIVAQKEFGVEDEEILSAIRWHTLGRINMTTFEKIIFLADKIEERTRPCEICEPIKNALKEENGLDKALFICYKNTIKSLAERELPICGATVKIYNTLL